MIHQSTEAMIMTWYWSVANEHSAHMYTGFCPVCAEYEHTARIITSDTKRGECIVCSSRTDDLKPMWRYTDGQWITAPGLNKRRIVTTREFTTAHSAQR